MEDTEVMARHAGCGGVLHLYAKLLEEQGDVDMDKEYVHVSGVECSRCHRRFERYWEGETQVSAVFDPEKLGYEQVAGPMEPVEAEPASDGKNGDVVVGSKNGEVFMVVGVDDGPNQTVWLDLETVSYVAESLVSVLVALVREAHQRLSSSE